jgi:tRNA A64-2'-O-ribosylphosphate transferase
MLGGKVTGEGEWVRERGFMEVGLGKGKIGSRNLRQALGDICGFLDAYLRGGEAGGLSAGEKKLVILCETGRDLSVGVALAVYCWSFDDDGNMRTNRENAVLNKAMIRVRLGRIMTAMPNANPNRATLQSVNSFLMDWQK